MTFQQNVVFGVLILRLFTFFRLKITCQVPEKLQQRKKCYSDSPKYVALHQPHINLYLRCELISLKIVPLKPNRLEILYLDCKFILMNSLVNCHSFVIVS